MLVCDTALSKWLNRTTLRGLRCHAALSGSDKGLVTHQPSTVNYILHQLNSGPIKLCRQSKEAHDRRDVCIRRFTHFVDVWSMDSCQGLRTLLRD